MAQWRIGDSARGASSRRVVIGPTDGVMVLSTYWGAPTGVGEDPQCGGRLGGYTMGSREVFAEVPRRSAGHTVESFNWPYLVVQSGRIGWTGRGWWIRRPLTWARVGGHRSAHWVLSEARLFVTGSGSAKAFGLWSSPSPPVRTHSAAALSLTGAALGRLGGMGKDEDVGTRTMRCLRYRCWPGVPSI